MSLFGKRFFRTVTAILTVAFIAAACPAAAFAGERHEGVQGEVIAWLERLEKGAQRRADVQGVGAALGEIRLGIADIRANHHLLDEVRCGQRSLQHLEHLLLGGGHVWLVEGAHLHEVAAQGCGVFPHDEMFRQFIDRIYLAIEAGDLLAYASQAHLELLDFVP